MKREKRDGPVWLVLVSRSFNGRVSLKVKHSFDGGYGGQNRKNAERVRRQKLLFFREHNLEEPDYRVLGAVQLKRLRAEVDEIHKRRRRAGIARVNAERKRTGERRQFILCPTCEAKSKKLFSEMGGLQTRVCRNGHHFEVDTFFGFETSKRRVENTDRPLFTDGSYSDYVYGRYKEDPEGKQDR
jgi:hypothetical protein